MSRLKLDADGVPLIIEDHPKQYKGFPFITYIQFHNTNVLAIVDNVHAKQLQGYVLDLCQPAEVDENVLIEAATNWYSSHSHKMPFSVYMNQIGLGEQTSKVY